MVFTLGNLIVLLTACAVIILFRQYDRNNRSLGKIKKYVDVVRADLERMVQERIVQVRDLTIDFDVYRKRGQALVGRLRHIDSLSTDKIDTYQQQLKHLDKKVDRTMDTISQLDTYHKNSGEKFSHFQKYAHQIESQFEAISKDADALEELRTSLPGIISQQNERVQQLIDRKYTEVTGQIADFQQAHQDNIRSIHALVHDGAAELRRAGTRAHHKITAVARALTARERAQRKELSTHISKLQDRQDKQIADAQTQYSAQVTHLVEQERDMLVVKIQNVQKTELQRLTTDSETVRKQFLHQQDQQFQELLDITDEKINALVHRSEQALSVAHTEHDSHAQSLNELRQKFTELYTDSERQLDTHGSQLQAMLDKQQHVLKEEDGRIQSQLTVIDDEIRSFQRSTDERVNAITREVNIALERAQRVEKSTRGQEKRLKDAIASHTDTFGEQIDTRVTKQFKSALEQTQRVIADAAHIEERYTALTQKHGQLIIVQSQGFESKVEKIVQSGAHKLHAIEKTLTSYANKVSNDQQRTKQEFHELSAEAQRQKERAVSKIQHEYQSKLQRQVEGLQSYLQKQGEKIDGYVNDRVQQLRHHIDERVDASKHELTHALSESAKALETQWKEMSTTSSRALHTIQEREQRIREHDTQFHRVLTDVDSRIVAQQEQVSSKIDTMHNTYEQMINVELGRLTEVLNERSADKDAEFIERLAHMGDELGERLEVEKKRLLKTHTEEIKGLIDDNLAQVQQTSLQEHEQIVSQQAQIRDEIAQSHIEIERLNETVREYSDSLQAEFAARYNEMTKSTETSFEEVNNRMHDSQAKFDKEHGVTIAHMGRETKRLRDELAQVHSAHRDVGEHAKALRKATALQQALSDNAEALRVDMDRMTTQHTEVKRIAQEFSHIQDAAHKVQQVFTRMSGERRKIDSLEKSWKHLNGLSETVERNLDKMHSKYDRVQDLQVRLRDLDTLEKDVHVRYEHLANQQNVIQSTIVGVEKNFDSLSLIEERLQQIDGEVKDLPNQVSELSEQVSIIRDNSLTATELRQQGKQLDKSLSKLEKRMSEVKNSQQWLGNLETRLQKMYVEADEKVSLMHSLMQSQTADESAVPSDSSIPDTIKQLARRSWTPEQISNALKISIGEIEVVLGMATGSR